MADMSFEQKFGRLADTQLNDKLPSLVPYRVGFQVIDKNDEETKAVGISGYLMNNVWLYVPVFFLEGDIKGTNLMYVKQRDIFVPALDNWITALAEHGLTTLGSARDDSLGESADMYFSPEATNLFQNFQSKSACVFDDNSLIDEETWRRMQKVAAQITNDAGTLADIPKLGKAASKAFVNTFLHNTEFANALFHVYDVDAVQKIAEECAVQSMEKESAVKEKVEFYTDETDPKAQELSNSEKKLLINHGIFIRDARTNFSKVFHEEVNTGVLQNPAQPGIYDVMLEDGSYKTYIILFPKDVRQENSMFRQRNSNTRRRIALVDTNKPEEYISAYSYEINARPTLDLNKAYKAGLQGGRKATLNCLAEIPEGSALLFVQDPSNCIETSICQQRRTEDGSPFVFVRNTAGNTSMEGMLNRPGRQLGEARVEFTGEAGSLSLRGDTLYVPSNVRVFASIPEWAKRNKEMGYGSCCAEKQRSLNWGTPETVYQMVFKQAGLNRLELEATRNTASIKCRDEYSGLLSREDALRTLIFDHGIYAGQAVDLLKEASRADKGRKTFMIKHAAGYDMAAYGRSKRPFQGGPSGRQKDAVTETTKQQAGKALTSAKDSSGTPMLPQQAIDRAMRAAKTGIKEVFDTGVLAELVDKADISELRKDYITDMVRGMDKVGRMLFLFYWHTDEFEERYGKEDIKKMEDTMKKVFASTGDLVLFLKEKTAYSPDATESLFGNLSEDVATADPGNE